MKRFLAIVLLFAVMFSFRLINTNCQAFAVSENNFYTVYSDKTKSKILFTKGDEVNEGDKYLSHENDLYEIESVDDKSKTAIAKFIKKETLPKVNVKKKSADGEIGRASCRERV